MLEIELNVSVQTQAVLLLTAWFTKPEKSAPKPLSPSEWSRLALWLKDRGLAPEVLLTDNDPLGRLDGWTDRTITPERIGYLLGRAGALGLALEKWQRAGLWVMTRPEADYPSRLKKRLKFDAPPLLFGCGNRDLLDKGGVAIIGSRDATEADLAYTTQLGGGIAGQGYSVVSGGARGVDEAAMLGALDKEGTVIGILSDSLLRAATSAKYRKGLMASNLVLVSPFNPEAGFDVGNAMARNKYIYCLADAAVVVATSKDKGGTWTGALEDIKQDWVPLWVKPHADSHSGNAALVDRGARWLPEGALNVEQLMGRTETYASTLASLFDASFPATSPVPVIEAREPEPATTIIPTECQTRMPETEASGALVPEILPQQQGTLSFYDFFLIKLIAATHTEPQTLEALQASMQINKTQLNDWLKRAVAEGKVNKFNKPTRYQFAEAGQRCLAL